MSKKAGKKLKRERDRLGREAEALLTAPSPRAGIAHPVAGYTRGARHIDQYSSSLQSIDPGKFIKRIDEPFSNFSGVYVHNHDNGYVLTTVPHLDGRCEEALRTCDGKCGSLDVGARAALSETGVKTFVLRRHEDASGISGTGDIAEGAVFSTGKVVVAWSVEATLAKVASVTVFDSLEDVEKVHGHGGMTEVVWT